MRKIFLMLSFSASLFLITACGSNRPETLPESGATLEGTITYGNEEVQFAMVIVEGGNAPGVTGKVGENGKYLIKNVPLGEVKIAVNTDAATGDYQTAIMSGGAYTGPESKGKKRVNVKFVKVPAKYFAPDTSGLKTTIVKGSNTFDIKIPK